MNAAKLKQIMVIDSAHPQKVHYFDTIKDAHEGLPKMERLMEHPHMFTLFSHAVQKVEFDWVLQTDTAANLRETTKIKAAPRKGAWSEIEVATLQKAVNDSLTFAAIGKSLHRSRGSTYQKALAMGFITCTPAKKKGPKKKVVSKAKPKGVVERKVDITKRNTAMRGMH